MKKTIYSASNWVIHMWALGGLANYWMAGVIYSFLSLVFITSYEMNPAWVAMAMMLPRLIDMVIDPLLGRLSDNINTRWGRRRPFIFVTTILGAFLVIGVWWLPLAWANNWKGFVYLLFFTTSLFINVGAFEMSHGALGYELSDDYCQRSTVQAARNFYLCIGSLGGGFTYWLAQRPIFGHGHLGEVHGFRVLSFGIAAIILVSGLLSVVAVRERFQNINHKHVKIWPALKATLTNRPFVGILAIRILNYLGFSLFRYMSFYVGIYSMCLGNKEEFNKIMTGWISVAGLLLGFAMLPLAAPFTQWLGKRRGLILFYSLACVQAVLLPFAMAPGRIYICFAVTMIFLPSIMIPENLLNSIMPDICDIDELEHGERREGLFTAVLSFVTKLENSFTVGVSGGLLVFSGFNQHLLQQPEEVLVKMRLCCFIPLITGSLLTLIAAYYLPFSKKLMDEVRSKLDARHAALHSMGENGFVENSAS